MKAVLYAVRGDLGWRAYVSVAWEVDWLFWLEERFRSGVSSVWDIADEAFAHVGNPAQLVRLKESLPLGIANSACGELQKIVETTRSANFENELQDAVRRAAARAGENETAWMMEMEKWTLGEATHPAIGQAAYERGADLAAIARRICERLSGRSLLQAEAVSMLAPELSGRDASALLAAVQLASLPGGIELSAGIVPVECAAGIRWHKSHRQSLRCRRCGSGEAQIRRTPCASCGRRQCAYCEACLTMGRSRECGLLVIGPTTGGIASVPTVPASPSELAGLWGLSPAQSVAAASALDFLLCRGLIKRKTHKWLQYMADACMKWRPLLTPVASDSRHPPNNRTFLIWAVTGAGKTEMIFPLLDAILTSGGKAAVATPRRDVVLELAPRLAKAFPNVRQTVLYGGSPDRFELGDLTIATTHQLIRFRHAFHLVIIDEVDAFPFLNDPMLHYAASQSATADGTTILLSATPSRDMQRRARRRRLPHARVSARHHGRPLPVPRKLAVPPLQQWIRRRRIPQRLLEKLLASVARGAQLFLFVPGIGIVEPLVEGLRDRAAELGIPPETIAGTSSQDPGRIAKVSAFRERTLRILVTTTILERGITIAKSDVFVLDADKPLFDASSLVQMAGRAGRSADDPDGFVYFAAAQWTESQREARRQIREMNRHARLRNPS